MCIIFKQFIICYKHHYYNLHVSKFNILSLLGAYTKINRIIKTFTWTRDRSKRYHKKPWWPSLFFSSPASTFRLYGWGINDRVKKALSRRESNQRSMVFQVAFQRRNCTASDQSATPPFVQCIKALPVQTFLSLALLSGWLLICGSPTVRISTFLLWLKKVRFYLWNNSHMLKVAIHQRVRWPSGLTQRALLGNLWETEVTRTKLLGVQIPLLGDFFNFAFNSPLSSLVQENRV